MKAELRRMVQTLRADVRQMDARLAAKLADIAVIEDLLAVAAEAKPDDAKPNHVPGAQHE